jgi:ribonuclease P protein component
LDVFFAASPASRSRLGLVVGKHGHEIVARNRLKRRLREIGRRQVLPGLDAAGVRADVLIRAKRSAYDVDFAKLEIEVKKALEDLCSEDS